MRSVVRSREWALFFASYGFPFPIPCSLAIFWSIPEVNSIDIRRDVGLRVLFYSLSGERTTKDLLIPSYVGPVHVGVSLQLLRST